MTASTTGSKSRPAVAARAPAPELGHRVCKVCNPGPRRPGQVCLCGHTTTTSKTFDARRVQLCTVCEDLAPGHVAAHVFGPRKGDR